MSENANEWKTIQSDILIIGGGFGGLWAAIRAAERGCSVTLVDKSFCGKSGHSYFAVGGRMVLLPDDDLDEYVHDVALGNDWLVDQDMVAAVFQGSYERLRDVESFGIPFRKSGGEYVRLRSRGAQNVKIAFPENATAADEVTILRKIALSKGVNVIDHVYVYDLVKGANNKIAGAAGIGVKKPRNYLFRARSIIIATNTGGYRGHHMACELQGTGPFMAYDAGAVLKNPEFHFTNVRPARHEIEGSGILPALGAKWTNAKGEHFMASYDPTLKDRAAGARIVVSVAKEVFKGNAPISLDVEGMAEEQRDKFRILHASHGWQVVLLEKCKRLEGYDFLKTNIEWKAVYETSKLGIEADLRCMSTVDGLFAAGMARTLGINPFTGWSIASSTWSGYTAGENAGEYAQNTDFGEIDFSDLSEKYRRFYEPARIESGVDPDKLVYKLQEILFPASVLIIMSEPKLKDALDQVMKLKEEIPRLKATDVRTLIKSKETQTMMLSAEMTLRASIMRKETRENIFYREDYPDADNDNWLKWIVVSKGKGEEICFATERVPFEKYEFKPEIGRSEGALVSSH